MSRTLFVTRRFPPSIGGMETLAAETWQAICDEPGARLIAHIGTNRGLIRWLPRAVVATRTAIRRGEVDCLLLGDGVVAAAVLLAIGRRRPRVVSMVMGLDLTYDRWGYPTLLRRGLKKSDLVLAISRSTTDLAVELGVDRSKVQRIRLGVHAPEVTASERAAARARLDEITGGATAGRFVVGTLGRLVKRKGCSWFVRSVLPGLPEVHYVIAGAGPEFGLVQAAARDAGVHDRVHLLGSVDDAGREVVLRGLDIFVQPNIQVPGDVEGFGLVTIEAAMRGTPVAAADIQGLTDAVHHERTGLLVAPEQPEAWRSVLVELLSMGGDLSQLGRHWADEARELYGPSQFHRSVREAVGLAPGG